MHDLHTLETPFSEDEVWAVVKELPNERAPGPDGFMGFFLQEGLGYDQV